MGRRFDISVIIPVYNTEKYVGDCIESILKQTFSNYEIILVDDGSTDGSGAICDYYANDDKLSEKIKVIHRDNQGPAATRRIGVENAQGEFVCFIDSDDWVSTDYLEVLYGRGTAENADIITTFFTDVYDNGKRVPCPNSMGKNHANLVKEDSLITDGKEGFIYEIHGSRNITTGPYPKLIKRSLFEGIDYHEDVTIGEDYSMILQLMAKASRILILNKYMYFRRIHGKNISRQGYTLRHKKALDNYIKIRNELITKYNQYNIEILGYHIEYELAVITAMCRNKAYDKSVINKLKEDLRINMKDILKKCRIPLYYKVCCVLIAYFTGAFIFMFRILHLLTGR